MNPTVLLVEDSATIRYLLTNALASRNIKVVTAEHASEVVSAAKTHLPGVIVINKMLPGRDGHSVIRELRADPACGHMRIMMLTESKSRDDVLSAIQGGADAYVVKPFDAGDVAGRIEELLKRVPTT